MINFRAFVYMFGNLFITCKTLYFNINSETLRQKEILSKIINREIYHDMGGAIKNVFR